VKKRDREERRKREKRERNEREMRKREERCFTLTGESFLFS